MTATNKDSNHKELPKGYKYSNGYIIPESWSTVRFDSVFKRLTRKNAENNQNVLTISAQQGLISQMDYYNTLYASEDKSGYSLLEKGDFAYNKSYSTDYAYGAIKCLEKCDKGIVSPLYICFSPRKGTNAEFYKQYFEAGRFDREIYRIAQEGARNHGLLNVSTEEFFASALVFPPNDEQKKIAEILAHCDKMISLCQSKINELNKQKKYFLKEMFPQQGSNVPNIHFPGFTVPWEQRKFADVFDCTIPNNTLSRAELNSDVGEVLNVHYGDVLIKYGSVIDVQRDNLPYIIGKTADDFKGTFLRDGDIVIADTAEDETTGKACEIDIPKWYQDFIRWYVVRKKKWLLGISDII